MIEDRYFTQQEDELSVVYMRTSTDNPHTKGQDVEVCMCRDKVDAEFLTNQLNEHFKLKTQYKPTFRELTAVSTN